MDEPRLHNEVEFYEQIAGMLYAVLMSDHSFHRQEAKRLRDILGKHVVEADAGNVLKTEEGMQVLEKQIGRLLTSNTDPLEALDAFKLYREANARYFTTDIQQALWKSANALAYAAAGQNKSELIILQELKTILHQPV